MKNPLFKVDQHSNAIQDESSVFIAAVRTPFLNDRGAVIRAAFLNPGGIHVRQTGYNIYGPKGDLLKCHTETCSHPEERFSVSYNITEWADKSLNRNKGAIDLQYEFFIIHDDVTYVTDRISLQTG